MPRTPSHADLVARALGALPEADRARVDEALERDPALRRRFEQISAHLLLYDQLPPAPPPPPVERLRAAMDADGDRDPGVLRLQRVRPRLRPAFAWSFAAAAAIVIALLLVKMTWVGDEGALGAGARLVAGPGMQVTGGPEAVLTCAKPAEARLGERVRLVLDGGATLRIEGGEAVHLESGRAWFEVAPGAFEVRTPHGPVSVSGTRFEVDVRGDGLEVAVAEGLVTAGGLEVAAGERLAQGAVGVSARAPGAWFRAPELDLEVARPESLAPGRPLDLRLVFHNPNHVPMRVEGPRAARTPIWIRFETLTGRTVGDLPVLTTNVTSGGEFLRPGGSLDLAPEASSALTVRILPPPGCPPAYRCKALYRPEGQPAVLSSPLHIEVR